MKVINVTNILGDGQIDTSNTNRHISMAEFSKTYSHFAVDAGDIVIASSGNTYGKIGRISAKDLPLMMNTSVIRFRPSDAQRLDGDFLYAFLRSEMFRGQIESFVIGSAQPNFGPSHLKQMVMPLPSLSVQRRIAGILSAYDELIENSQRRIRILEAMARGLYREWFVRFRFPGHEKVRRVASPLGEIPEGWEVTTLGAHLAALESGKRPKGGIREVEDGVPSIGAENINGIGRHDFDGEKFVSREFFQEMRKGVVRDRDVAIYKDGAYIGKSSYFRDGFPHAECCVNEHVFLLRSNGIRLKQNGLYLWLQEPDTVHAIRATNANAAQPGINQQTVGGLKLLVPDEKTAAHFDRLAEPLLAEVINLAKRIQNLRRTRDLLLPRLLSGQVELTPGAN
jgi:type I restriction enzyme S subunit